MATVREPIRSEKADESPPPSYESVVTQQNDTGEKATTATPPEVGYTYPSGYTHIPSVHPNTQPYTEPYRQPAATGHHYIPGSFSYPPQLPLTPLPSPTPLVNYVIVSQPSQDRGHSVQTCGQIRQRKPPNFMCFSLVTCLCFNHMFGLLALAFSCYSDTAYVSGDMDRARRYGRYALFVNVSGILVSLLFALILTSLC